MYLTLTCLFSTIFFPLHRVIMIPVVFCSLIFFLFPYTECTYNPALTVYFKCSLKIKKFSFPNVLKMPVSDLIFSLSLEVHRIISDQSEYILLLLYLMFSFFSAWFILQSCTLCSDDVSITARPIFSFVYAFLDSL